MHLSIFDLDRTLIKTNISFKFYLYLYNKSIFDKKIIFRQLYFFLKFKYFGMTLRDLHKVIFNKSLKNKDFNDLKKHIDIFLDKYLNKIFYMPVVKRLQKAIFDNHYIVLLSSSPFFLVEPISNILKANECKATLYSLNKNNQFEDIDFIMDGKEKAKYAQILMKKLKITKDKVEVYSDSIEDLELFEIAGKQIAVRPCKKLYKIAKYNKWEII